MGKYRPNYGIYLDGILPYIYIFLEKRNYCFNKIIIFSVQVYLDLNRSIDELYYEKYDNVAVMFASLTDYKLGLENDEDLSDKFVLGILDEVISDFDRVSFIVIACVDCVAYCTRRKVGNGVC